MRKNNRARIIIVGLIAIITVGLVVFFACDLFSSPALGGSTRILAGDPNNLRKNNLNSGIRKREPVPDIQVDVPEVESGIKSVILMIGDGMGAAHRQAAQYANAGYIGQLVMDTLPVRGELITSPADTAITDSAASATAMATGHKTNNKVIGLDPNLNFIPTILEQAQILGKSVGLITTTHLAHATPAGFAAHVDSRYAYEKITLQLLRADVNVLLGGGEVLFTPPEIEGCYPEPGLREDGRDIISEMIADGYTYICDGAGLANLDLDSTTHLLGLFGDGGMIKPFDPTLAEMTAAAIEVLKKDPDGFFLMVEGGQIDWAAHDNDAAKVIANTLALDEAVGIAKEYIEGAGDSLLIVTADHETGGMSVVLLPSGKSDEDGPFTILGGGKFYVNWTTGGHTAANVPLTASGPFSDQFDGIHENTIIHDLILEGFCAYDGLQPVLEEGENPCGSPEIEIQGNGIPIGNGDLVPSEDDGTNFGPVELDGDNSQSIFSITNSGDKDLYLTGSPIIEITGYHPEDYSITLLPSSPIRYGDGVTTFVISFNPFEVGPRRAIITIPNSDPDQDSYQFAVWGTGIEGGD